MRGRVQGDMGDVWGAGFATRAGVGREGWKGGVGDRPAACRNCSSPTHALQMYAMRAMPPALQTSVCTAGMTHGSSPWQVGLGVHTRPVGTICPPEYMHVVELDTI